MRRILLSLLGIALVGSLAGGGLFAYFSDTETSTGNTFTAGTIDIELTGDVGGRVWQEHSARIYDFKPCETGYLEFTVTNVGLNPAHIWKHIIRAEGSENGIVQPEQKWYDENLPAGGTKDITAADLWFDLTVTDPDGTERVLIPADTVSMDRVISHFIYLGVLEPQQSMTVTQSFHLMAETENWAQSDLLTFSEEYYAEQMGGPGPAPVW